MWNGALRLSSANIILFLYYYQLVTSQILKPYS